MNTNLINNSLQNLVTCWNIKLRNGHIYGFAQTENDIVIDGITYYSSVGFNRSAMESDASFNVDNLSIDGIIDHHLIKHEDLIAGLFDYAQVSVFLTDTINAPTQKINLRTGWFGQVTINEGNFIVEIRGLLEAYSQKIGEIYSPQCRAQLGDSRCKFDLTVHLYHGCIKKILNSREFIDPNINQPDNYYKYGKVKFLSSLNQGIEIEVLEQINNKIILTDPPPFKMSKTDNFVLTPGCDRSYETCREKFCNVVNFRGEPFIQQVNKFLF